MMDLIYLLMISPSAAIGSESKARYAYFRIGTLSIKMRAQKLCNLSGHAFSTPNSEDWNTITNRILIPDFLIECRCLRRKNLSSKVLQIITAVRNFCVLQQNVPNVCSFSLSMRDLRSVERDAFSFLKGLHSLGL